MVDVSDGLVADLGHVARASGVGIDLDSALLRDPAVTLEDVLHGGEDHALVATTSGPLSEGCRVVGRVVKGSQVTVDGAVVSGGWEHFG